MTTEEILEELKKRENVSNTKDEVLVLGSIGNDGGTNFMEAFKKIKTPDDLDFLTTYALRARFNPHRKYKVFYFKTTDFDVLEKTFNNNNEDFANWILQNKHIQYVNI